jgi:superoxide dismutase, Fe-Mn family
MPFELPALPWAEDALAPHISAETIQYHYGKHHAAYVANLNKLTTDTDFADASLEEIILKADGGIFNNAAQVWNHSFYWNCLSPNGGNEPQGALADAINSKWGDFKTFRDEFSNAAATRFGSGWAWLVLTSDGQLDIVSTANADNPMTDGLIPLLTCDVWEHAYYIDTRNSRPQYIENFWKLVNWEFVTENLTKAS